MYRLYNSICKNRPQAVVRRGSGRDDEFPAGHVGPCAGDEGSRFGKERQYRIADFRWSPRAGHRDRCFDCRDWDVVWAIATRVDPARDLLVVDRTPIDYLDFASPEPGLGGKLGIDATNKWPPETKREWGRPIVMDPEIVRRVDQKWARLGLGGVRRVSDRIRQQRRPGREEIAAIRPGPVGAAATPPQWACPRTRMWRPSSSLTPYSSAAPVAWRWASGR